MHWVVIAAAWLGVAGCRQVLGLEDGVVAIVGHDEDADGIDDGIDNCPADVNQTQSFTERGIGRVCDPRPEEDGDEIALFFSFFPSGVPDELESDLGVTYEADMVRIEDASIRTNDAFMPTVVAASMTFGTFIGTEALVELSVGNRSCRIAPCNSRICVIAADDTTTATAMFTPTALGVTFALVQTDTQLACVLTLQGTYVSLPQIDRARDRVRVRVEEATMLVQNLTIYDVP